MKKIDYEDGSWCLETTSGAIISNTTLIDGFATLHTDTDFERIHFLLQEGYSKEDAKEILDWYKENVKKIFIL